MEEQTRTIRFVHNAMDRFTGAQYSGGNVRTLPADVAQRFVGAGVAVEEGEASAENVPTIQVPAPHGLEDLTVAQLKDKAKAEGVDVSGLNTKAELVSAFSNRKEG